MDVRKADSIVFQLNFIESKGQADRYFTFYKQLLRKRRLARFCRDAFIEKADRNLNGLEDQYSQLRQYIQSKGIQYILDAVREKEQGAASAAGEVHIENAVNEIMEALMKRLQNEFPHPSSLNTNVNPVNLPKPKPDMERLIALL
jgi:hypothetical protein